MPFAVKKASQGQRSYVQIVIADQGRVATETRLPIIVAESLHGWYKISGACVAN
jgi:hypothetical protein